MNKFKRVFIAVDGGPSSENLAQAGLELAEQLKAEVSVLLVVDTRTILGTEGLSVGEAIAIERGSAAGNLKILIKNVFHHHPVSHYIVEGTPYEKILQFAKEWSADLIVVGTHGRKGLSRLVLGSVAEKVARHANIPVTIIPVNHG